jgi:hypothetical protein
MGGPPMGMPPPVRRGGVSKAVPVVVSAGLAVGVFCGLLFGIGTGKKDAIARPSRSRRPRSSARAPAPPLPARAPARPSR